MGLLTYLKSTILSKVVMAVTGVILLLFVLGHTVGNLQLFLGREVFNAYAHFLQSAQEPLWVVRTVLFLSLVLHIITSVKLKLHNYSAKPDKYRVKNYVKAKLTSRTMIWTGIFVFAFLTYHILHFTMGKIDPSNYGHIENYGPGGIFERHDAFLMVVAGFNQPIVSAIYAVWVILLGFHLNHALQSAFQTLGWNHPKYFPCIQKLSVAFSIFISLALLSIPAGVLTGLIGGLTCH